MMPVTFTCVPPSCSARLPQKFSAATTLITVELPLARPGEVEQPASASTSRTAAPAARRVDDMARTLTKTGSVIKCTGRYTTRSAGAARIRCREGVPLRRGYGRQQPGRVPGPRRPVATPEHYRVPPPGPGRTRRAARPGHRLRADLDVPRGAPRTPHVVVRAVHAGDSVGRRYWMEPSELLNAQVSEERMEIGLLGPVQVRTPGGLVDPGQPRQRCVLAALAVDAGRPVPVETLLDRTWGPEQPRNARQALYVYVTGIRKLIERAGSGTAVRLVRYAGGYLLDMDPDRVDLHRFRSLVAAARDPGCPDPKRITLLQEARELWRGTPLSDLPGDWPAGIQPVWQNEYLDPVTLWARIHVEG